MNDESFEKSARPSTWHGAHNGDIRPQDGSFAQGIPTSTDRKLISAGRSTAGFGDGRTLKRISVPSWMCRVCCSFETSRSILEAPEFTLATVFPSEWWVFVSDAVVLQYVGFETKGAIREYTFTLRGTGGASSEYFVTIANDAFLAHRVRYQDAPDICSLRLHREFATQTDRPHFARFSVTDAELADYQDAHAPKPKPSAYTHREDKES